MPGKRFYQKLYRIIGDRTPLATDCGKLCGAACCEESDVGEGMYLFPGEEACFFPAPKDSTRTICKTAFEWTDGRYLSLYSCPGTCRRDLRPLACRIFPLVPYKRPHGRLRVVLDPRAAHGLCPLASGSIRRLSPDFVRAVRRAMHYAAKSNAVRQYIEAQTEELLVSLLTFCKKK